MEVYKQEQANKGVSCRSRAGTGSTPGAAPGHTYCTSINFYCVCAFWSPPKGGGGQGSRGARGEGSSNDTFARRSEARGNNELCT